MSKAVFAVFILLFFNFASADLLVGVTPKAETGKLVLYPHETTEYVVSVFNDSEKSVENVVLKISADDALLLVKSGNEARQITETIAEVKPTERQRVLFTIKAGERVRENARITVEYGLNQQFTNSITAGVDIIDTPLRLEARALRSTLKIGDRSSIAVNAKNVGREKLQNALFELVLPAGITPLNQPIVIPEMNPGDALVDKGFGFELDPGIRGRKTIIVRAAFTESGRLKVLEKSVEIDVHDRDLVIGGIMAVVVILVLIAVFTRKEKKEKKEQGTEKKARKTHE